MEYHTYLRFAVHLLGSLTRVSVYAFLAWTLSFLDLNYLFIRLLYTIFPFLSSKMLKKYKILAAVGNFGAFWSASADKIVLEETEHLKRTGIITQLVNPN